MEVHLGEVLLLILGYTLKTVANAESARTHEIVQFEEVQLKPEQFSNIKKITKTKSKH